jgi:putative aldouronate transport system substrate-binding protein
MRKIVAVLLLIGLALPLFAGGKKEAGSAGSSERTETIVIYLLGEPPIGFDPVLEQLNAKLMADLNIKAKFNFLSWGDWDTRYPLIINSGEPFDLIYTADWCFFGEFKNKKGFMALDALLAANAPNIAANLDAIAREQCSYNGSLYMIPAMETELNENGYLIRGDLRKKYGVPPIKNEDDLELYLAAIKKNEPQMIPFNAGYNDTGLLASMVMFGQDWSPTSFRGSVFHSLKNPENLFSWYFTPEYEAFVQRMKQWSDQGFWSKNVLSNEGIAKDAFKLGTGGMAIVNTMELNDIYRAVKAENPSWELEWYVMGPGTLMTRTAFTGNGYALGAASRNPEKALQVLDKFIFDESYYDLLFYGISGVNYKLNSQGQLVAGSGNFYSGEDISIWGMRNPNFVKYPPNLFPGFVDLVENLMSKAVSSPYVTFTLDRSAIESELAAFANVETQYARPLVWGLMDPVQGVKILRDELKVAGIEKIVAESKRQGLEYLKK